MIQLRNKVLDLRFLLRVNVLKLNCAVLPQCGILFLGNTHIVEQKQGLHELLHAVHAVGFHIVDCIQQIQNDFKRAKSCTVCRVLNDWDTKNLRLTANNLPCVGHFIEVVFRVTAENDCPIVHLDILDRHEGRISQLHGIHHKAKPGVKGINLKRGFIFIFRCVRHDHAISRAADVEPVRQFLILCRFVLGQNIIVQFCHHLGGFFIGCSADILDGFAHQIANLKGHNFVCPVFNNLVVNLRAYILYSRKDRLVAFIVPV